MDDRPERLLKSSSRYWNAHRSKPKSSPLLLPRMAQPMRAVVKQTVRGQRTAIADALRKVVASINGEAAASKAEIGAEKCRGCGLEG